jgi:hypothetical protein
MSVRSTVVGEKQKQGAERTFGRQRTCLTLLSEMTDISRAEMKMNRKRKLFPMEKKRKTEKKKQIIK